MSDSDICLSSPVYVIILYGAYSNESGVYTPCVRSYAK